MKNKLLKISLLILAGVAIFIACRRELIEAVDSSGFTVDKAKTYYETLNSGFITVKSANANLKTIEATPEWYDAKKGSDDSYDYVETHLKSSSSIILMDEQTKQDWDKIKYEGMYASLTHLVVRQNKKDKTIETFAMTMIPDKDWLVKNPEKLKDVTYCDRPKDYSGVVFYNDLNGNFVNGWKYTDGKVTRKVTQNSGEPVVRLKDTYCYPMYVYELFGYCPDAYGGEVSYCTVTHIEYVGSYEVCVNTYGGSSSGDYNGGSGSIPSSPIPSFNSLATPFTAVAEMDAESVYYFIGGNVLYNYQNNPTAFSNACALRLSYALNMVPGCEIPYTSGQTLSGDVNNDGVKEWYFYRVSDMVNYLNYKYGNPTSTTTNSIQGATGIIWQNDCNWGDASGHLDIWTGSNALNHYYNECNNVYIWKN